MQIYKKEDTYLNVIGVQFRSRQAVESAEVQTTRKDTICSAALSANKILHYKRLPFFYHNLRNFYIYM